MKLLDAQRQRREGGGSRGENNFSFHDITEYLATSKLDEYDGENIKLENYNKTQPVRKSGDAMRFFPLENVGKTIEAVKRSTYRVIAMITIFPAPKKATKTAFRSWHRESRMQTSKIE